MYPTRCYPPPPPQNVEEQRPKGVGRRDLTTGRERERSPAAAPSRMAAAAAARRPEVPSWRRPLAVSPTTPTSGAAQMKRGKRPSAPTRPICPSRRIAALKAHALLQWLHQCSPAQPSDAPLSLSLVTSLGRPAAADLAGRRHRRRRQRQGMGFLRRPYIHPLRFGRSFPSAPASVAKARRIV